MALACHVWVPQRFLDAWPGDFHLLSHVFWGQDVSTMQDTLTQVWKIGSWISEVICITNVKVTFLKLCFSLYIPHSHISPLPSICRKRQDQFIGPHHKGISQKHSSDWLKCIVHHGKTWMHYRRSPTWTVLYYYIKDGFENVSFSSDSESSMRNTQTLPRIVPALLPDEEWKPLSFLCGRHLLMLIINEIYGLPA